MRISDWSSDVCSSDLAGEIGAREGARRKDFAERRNGAVAEAPLARLADVAAEDEAMPDRAGREVGARIRRGADDAIFEGVEPRAVGGGGAVFLGILIVFAVLPVKRDAREIDRALAFPAPVERDALAFAGIPPFEAIDGRGEDR